MYHLLRGMDAPESEMVICTSVAGPLVSLF